MRGYNNNHWFKFFVFCLSLFTFSLSFPLHGRAETSAEGFAIYHDRAFGVSPYWHTAMMLTSSPENGYAGTFYTMDGSSHTVFNSNYSVIHLSSASNTDNGPAIISLTSYNSFLGGKTFKGYYTSVSNPSLYSRRTILATALKFYNYAISYRALNQIDYSIKYISFNDRLVFPSEITKFRCDGFLEYCYEFNNIRAFGPSYDAEQWNISYNCVNSRIVHNTNSLNTLSPEIQARNLKCKLGDIDADGAITSEDARLALRYSTQLETPTNYQSFVANVTGAGDSIMPDDARLILRAATGLEGNGINADIGTESGYRFPNDPFA